MLTLLSIAILLATLVKATIVVIINLLKVPYTYLNMYIIKLQNKRSLLQAKNIKFDPIED